MRGSGGKAGRKRYRGKQKSRVERFRKIQGEEEREGARRKLVGEQKVRREKNKIRKREATMEGKKGMSGDKDNLGRRRKGQEEKGKDGYGRTGRNVTVRGRREGSHLFLGEVGTSLPSLRPCPLFILTHLLLVCTGAILSQ